MLATDTRRYVAEPTLSVSSDAAPAEPAADDGDELAPARGIVLGAGLGLVAIGAVAAIVLLVRWLA